jgi:hypothetical protein
MSRATIALRVLVIVLLAAAMQSATCPIDDSGAYFTGKTITDRATGKLLKEYKCYRNSHVFWVR